jgi:hypothetical protein
MSLFSTLVSLLVLAGAAQADQVEMQNGDRYNGKILSLTNDTLVLQSELLGNINVPRAKVAKMLLGASASSNATASASGLKKVAAKPAAAPAASSSELLASIKKLGSQTNEVEQVKQQFLADADPAAKAKFDEMLASLLTGKMSMSDLAGEAKTAAAQLKAMKKELGSEADPALDGYLSILENFLREVPASDSAKTATPQSPAPRSKARPEADPD